MKKIGLVFAMVALLFLYSTTVSARECVEWKTEIYQCGITMVPLDGDPFSTGEWVMEPVWCEREVCVKWAKSDQPSGTMYAQLSTGTSVLYANASMPENEIEVTVTGILERVFAIGGETTGWRIKLDTPLQVEGEMLGYIEIDIGDLKINLAAFKGDTVEVTGNLMERRGIEKGLYWVLMVERFSRIKII